MEQKKSGGLPRSVVILVCLLVLQAASLLVYGGYVFYKHGVGVYRTGAGLYFIPLVMFESISSGVVLLVLGVLMLIVAFAIARLKQWAWLAAMSIQGLGLLAGLEDYIHHRPNYIGMLLGIVVVLYLNHEEVQTTFRRKQEMGHG